MNCQMKKPAISRLASSEKVNNDFNIPSQTEV